MDFITILGLLAGALTATSFFPQVIKVYKTKRTNDLSLLMFSLFSIGIAFWLIYGLLISEIPIIAANGVTLIASLYILVMKIKHG